MRTCWLCTLQCSLAKRKTEFLCRDNEGITLMAFANRSQLILFQIRREVAFSCFYEPQTVFYSAIIYQQISQISISKLVKTNPIAVCVTSAQLCGLFAFALCLNWAFTPLFCSFFFFFTKFRNLSKTHFTASREQVCPRYILFSLLSKNWLSDDIISLLKAIKLHFRVTSSR